jgi:hypothetical protein
MKIHISFQKITIPFLLLFIIIFSCEKEAEERRLEDILSKHTKSNHFNYYMSKDDYVDTVFQETYINWLMGEFNTQLINKIDYYKFKDIDHIYELTGIYGNAFMRDGKVYTIWPVDNHECVHVLTSAHFGRPRVLFNEGIAVAHQAYWINGVQIIDFNGEDFNLTSKQLLSEGKLPGILHLINDTNFRGVSPLTTYPASGSFVRYLIDEYGLSLMIEFFICSNGNDSDQKIQNDFESIFGLSLVDAWLNWREFIINY